MNALKTGTSRRLRTMFAQELAGVYSKPVLWSRSYCVLSCGGAPLEIIQQYIQQQAGCAYPLQPMGAALPPGRKRPAQMDGAPRAIRWARV